uniref:Uncharacterized protein n=1 Tax=Arundo donax TaxID=35708 RepID=A0A0A9FPI3_ARUDO
MATIRSIGGIRHRNGATGQPMQYTCTATAACCSIDPHRHQNKAGPSGIQDSGGTQLTTAKTLTSRPTQYSRITAGKDMLKRRKQTRPMTKKRS